tara:strand:+ start:1606 stop:3066 length:1461 start_codon:yes stop_codon:yes gene_type:complete
VYLLSKELKQNTKIIPIILSGGIGSRLWPLSRSSYPKQYLKILKKESLTLLQKSYKRLVGLENLEPPIIICNEEHRFIVAEQMREINVKPSSIILEPFGKNTAPAITIAALKAKDIDEKAVLIVLSADHEIEEQKTFQNVIINGIEEANQGKIVTFGIPPKSPETGYGYIEAVKEIDLNLNKAYEINRFIEKPNHETAKKLIQNKRYLWNSGIFMFQSDTFIREVKNFSPKIFNSANLIIKSLTCDLDFQRIDKEVFQNCPDISIDFAIMEKTDLGIVIPLNANWSDIGNWKSVWQYSPKDKDGNAIEGKVIINRSEDCYFRSEDRLIVGLGLKNLFVIETSDTVLIADKNESENIKNIVNFLNDKNMAEGTTHKKIFRPWGYYHSIEEDIGWQIKKIIVKPSASLSLQLHHHRSEHWIIVKGTAEVEIDNKKMLYTENQSAYIPLGSKHRLSNPGKVPLTLIEVQSGEYLGEDDIVRFEDKYNRI